MGDAAGDDGLGAAEPRDGDGEGAAVAGGLAVRVALGVRPAGLGTDRAGPGDRVGPGADDAGLGVVAGLTAGGADSAGAAAGRTRMYRASTAANSPLSTIVEVRGRPVTRRSRPAGRWQGRPRR